MSCPRMFTGYIPMSWKKGKQWQQKPVLKMVGLAIILVGVVFTFQNVVLFNTVNRTRDIELEKMSELLSGTQAIKTTTATTTTNYYSEQLIQEYKTKLDLQSRTNTKTKTNSRNKSKYKKKKNNELENELKFPIANRVYQSYVDFPIFNHDARAMCFGKSHDAVTPLMQCEDCCIEFLPSDLERSGSLYMLHVNPLKHREIYDELYKSKIKAPSYLTELNYPALLNYTN